MEMGHATAGMGAGSLERSMSQPYRIHFAMIPSRDIFGMVGRCGGGYNSQWTDWTNEGRIRRSQIMKEFEEGLNDICGHYDRLESSILKEGVRNPIVITCGPPRRRTWNHLPPEMHAWPHEKLLLLETTMGGSRLHVCQKHNMEIACIINDWTGRFRSCPEIRNEQDARICYLDQPDSIKFDTNLGMIENFSRTKTGYHLGEEWSEDKLMPLRAPLWIRIMNKYGYRVDKLPPIVEEVLKKAGVDQDRDLTEHPTR
jgi:hypothetical protein